MQEVLKEKVILDVDTGSDDAVAIMAALGSPELELIGIATVWGNLAVSETTANTLALCRALGSELKVYRGCERAMVKDFDPFQSFANNYRPIELPDGRVLKIHYNMLDQLPPCTAEPEPLSAVRFYLETLSLATEPISIIATGPLSNLGWVFYLRPDLAEKVGRFYLMGGGRDLSNVSESAEANIWHDAEALQYILDAGLKPTIVSLDATHSAALDLQDAAELRELGSFAGEFTAKMIEQRIEYESTFFNPKRKWSAIHDALAVCAFCRPELVLAAEELSISPSLEALNYGELLIDRREAPEAANARLISRADKAVFMAYLKELFR
ncbi:MAG: nucleoside hydrolase [Eubacteriales bacterium]|nr:nucleoside hydrolase [Eubacteriales bacterium]